MTPQPDGGPVRVNTDVLRADGASMRVEIFDFTSNE